MSCVSYENPALVDDMLAQLVFPEVDLPWGTLRILTVFNLSSASLGDDSDN